VTEAERYLRKARESLASAKADARAKRYNSAANRAYYAAFQAAVAALIHWRVRAAETDWEHRFVAAEFSGRLILRRKVFVREFATTLPRLFQLRIRADYRPVETSSRAAAYAVRGADAFVSNVSENMQGGRLSERRAPYGAMMKTRLARAPMEFVEDAKKGILDYYPDVEFRVIPRGERDFTLEVYGDYPDMWAVSHCLGDFVIDTLVEHDIWIVILGMPRVLPD
jgi:uncharacterized protein (UPF0332 family)